MLPALLTACSAVDVLNATVPSDTYQRTESLAYGPNLRQQVDVYQPKTDVKNAPMVVFFMVAVGRLATGQTTVLSAKHWLLKAS